MKKEGKRPRVYWLVSWSIVLLWMFVIFKFSSQVAEHSNELSKGVTQAVVEVIAKIVPEGELNHPNMNHLMRKNAHFFIYFILGILMLHALRSIGVTDKKSIFYAICLCFIYASFDEMHQLFVPGRGGQVKDVMLDTVGAMMGIFIYLCMTKVLIRMKIEQKKRQKRKLSLR